MCLVLTRNSARLEDTNGSKKQISSSSRGCGIKVEKSFLENVVSKVFKVETR